MHFSDIKYLLQSLLQLPKAIQSDGIIRFFFISGLISICIGAVIVGVSWVFGDDLGIKMISFIPWVESKEWAETVGIWLGRILVFALGIIAYKHLIINVTSQFLGGINDRIMENHKENLLPYKNPTFRHSLQR